jgi:hypothetical protein
VRERDATPDQDLLLEPVLVGDTTPARDALTEDVTDDDTTRV